MGCGQEKFIPMWWCHYLQSGFLANGHLLRVSRPSHLSANDKRDEDVKLRALHRSPGIYLRLKKTPENFS